ncbi:response regulator transcription factor [Rhodobacteraceae bacterium NNCM2]|nr:response regulator transcription factor [Coraliihabitans acroporae]
MRIVMVEDNVLLADGVAKALRDNGHAVDLVTSGLEGDAFLAEHGADLAILDVNLPGMTGFEILRAMRARGDTTPVLMLTARTETADRVAGLDAGADDYLVKPFEMSELLARVRALSRRPHLSAPAEETYGALRYDRIGRRLHGPEGALALSRRELALFEVLADRLGRIASKSSLVDAVYGVGADVEDNAIELQVSRLRRKLEGSGLKIHTARGLGYMLDEVVPDTEAPT